MAASNGLPMKTQRLVIPVGSYLIFVPLGPWTHISAKRDNCNIRDSWSVRCIDVGDLGFPIYQSLDDRRLKK